MTIQTFPNGPLMVNTYLVTDSKRIGVIIDPGHDVSALLTEIEKDQVIPAAILLTHAHYDHVAGIPDILKKYPEINIYLYKQDKDLLENLDIQTKMLGMPKIPDFKVNNIFDNTENISIGELDFSLLHTPGHSQGSISYLIEDKLFTGDLLFKTSVGRTDFFGGSLTDLMSSIKNEVFSLPENTIVYPGHGPSTTIGYEKEHNPFLK
jgi:glyoxylase-like metal-dependent hydrolase (beta-lactamase superfamily II)